MPVPYGSRFGNFNYTPSGGAQTMQGHLPTEPMSLGSPTTSPHTTHVHGTGSSTQYLPGFLMGDAVPITNVPAYSPNAAYSNVRPLQLSPVPVSPSSLGTPKHQDRLYRRINSPPTQSLWSMNQSNATMNKANNPTSDAWEVNGTGARGAPGGPLNRSINSADPFQSPQLTASRRTPGLRPLVGVVSPTPCGALSPEHLIDVLNTPKSANADRSVDNCWVTVFGYPASRASYILSQFAQFGTIEKHVITNDGNWMHIKYQNKLQARCALNRNGRVFGDSIMVGVTPCTDEDILNDKISGLQLNDIGDRENSMLHFQSPAAINRARPAGTPLRELTETPRTGLRNPKLLSQSFASPPERPAAGGGGGCGVARHSSMRSLTGDGRPAYLSRTGSVRQSKESGLLSKALGYMFGWS